MRSHKSNESLSCLKTVNFLYHGSILINIYIFFSVSASTEEKSQEATPLMPVNPLTKFPGFIPNHPLMMPSMPSGLIPPGMAPHRMLIPSMYFPGQLPPPFPTPMKAEAPATNGQQSPVNNELIEGRYKCHYMQPQIQPLPCSKPAHQHTQ